MSNAVSPAATSAGASLTVNAVTQPTAQAFVGSLTARGGLDGTGGAARLAFPSHIAVDAAGNAYFTDNGCALRKATPAGVVTTVAGILNSTTCSVDGAGANARFYGPYGVAVDSQGNVFVSQSTGSIRKVTPAGVVTTVAGADDAQGFADGQGNAVRFSTPFGIAIDAGDNLYVADSGNGAVRKIDSAGNVTTVARGIARNANLTDIPALDGPVGTATFMRPRAVAVDAAGSVYVADSWAVRKIVNGVVSTLAGDLSGALNATAYGDGVGLAAHFRGLGQMALDSVGNLYLADHDSYTVRKLQLSTGQVSTVLGVDRVATMNPAATPPTVYPVGGLAVTGVGQLLVSGVSVLLQATVP